MEAIILIIGTTAFLELKPSLGDSAGFDPVFPFLGFATLILL
jgi:hypothetical protein